MIQQSTDRAPLLSAVQFSRNIIKDCQTAIAREQKEIEFQTRQIERAKESLERIDRNQRVLLKTASVVAVLLFVVACLVEPLGGLGQ